MILRKPYAFLIKHFKLIHLIISALIAFLIARTNKILVFFKDYMNNRIIDINPGEYVNFLIYLSLILIIGLAISIIILMRKKKKPILFYILTTIVYVILFAGFIYLEGKISSLQYNILDRKTMSFSRDIARFMMIAQAIFIIPYIIRTLGFNIKKFDFKKDLQELDIELSDNEEFELVSPIDHKKIERVGRRRLRELKYYYIENKIFIVIILSVVSVFIGYKIITNITYNTNPKYKEQEVIKLDNFYTLTFDDSYIVTKDKNGKNISVNDKTFLVVKFTVNSTYNGVFSLESNKFSLKVRNQSYTPDKRYYDYFRDYGVGYKNQKQKLNSNNSYIFVYVIPEKYKNKKMTLEYDYRYDYSNKGTKMLKKIIKLDPEIVN